MAPPPAKRRKRLLVLSSDDEGRSTGMGRRGRKDAAKLPTPAKNGKQPNWKPTEEEPRSSQSTVGKSTHLQKNGSTSITTFFTATGEGPHQAKRMLSAGESAATALPVLQDAGEDAIEDFSDNEWNDTLKTTQDTTRAVLDRRKRTDKSNDSLLLSSSKNDRLPNGSQKFKFESKGNGNGKDMFNVNDMDQRPWAERFAPLNLDELAVHEKKVCDVRGWLENVYSGKHRKRLLILKGPAGAGKTVTLKMLAQVMKLEISEWKNPVGSEYSSEGYTSMSANFEDFLNRCGKFNRLEIGSMRKDDHVAMSSEIDARKIVLLEEFPNIFLSASTALQSFRSSVLQYLAASTPSIGSFYTKDSSERITPAIIIITETHRTSTNMSSDTFTVHRLLSSDILSHPAVSIIEFNPVAPTFIRKALDLVIQKEARHSGRRRVPGPSVLLKLSESGDVRSAIESLEFLCVRAQDHDDWGGRVAANAKRGANAKTAMTKMETDSLEIVTQRGNNLGLFHAVGKVVYNKRDEFALRAADDPTTEAPAQPPDHLPQHVRPRLPQTSVDQLMDETGTDADTFIAALHENYVISCEGSALTDTLDGCLDALSDGDLLGSSQDGRKGLSNRASYGTTTESLRQSEIAFQLVTRGLLFALPDPVKRSSHPMGVPGRRGGKGDSYKMFYPVSMRLSRNMEQTEYSIDRLHQLLEAGTAPLKKFASEKNRLTKFDRTKSQRNNPKEQLLIANDDQETFWTSLHCTKAELILERLPFITKIEQASPSLGHIGELENITQFHGIDVPDDEVSDNDDLEEFATSAAKSIKVPAIHQVGTEVQREVFKVAIPVEQEIGKLYLSEDDIEDDIKDS